MEQSSNSRPGRADDPVKKIWSRFPSTSSRLSSSVPVGRSTRRSTPGKAAQETTPRDTVLVENKVTTKAPQTLSMPPPSANREGTWLGPRPQTSEIKGQHAPCVLPPGLEVSTQWKDDDQTVPELPNAMSKASSSQYRVPSSTPRGSRSRIRGG